MEGSAAEEEVQDHNQPADSDEAKSEVQPLSVALEVACQAEVERAHGTLETPEERGVAAPSCKLDFGSKYPGRCQDISHRGLEILESSTYLIKYSG